MKRGTLIVSGAEPCYLVTSDAKADPLVTIRPNGTVELNPTLTLDEASLAFWRAVKAIGTDQAALFDAAPKRLRLAVRQRHERPAPAVSAWMQFLDADGLWHVGAVITLPEETWNIFAAICGHFHIEVSDAVPADAAKVDQAS